MVTHILFSHAEMYCDKMKLTDGMTVLELGCGWGSFTLFAVSRPTVATCTYADFD